jgi:hypothetical protein
MIRDLTVQGKPWLEIQDELEKAGIRQGDFRPLCFGSDAQPYRLHFIPKREPRILSKEFDEEITRIAREHSLIVQMRCTGYNHFFDTGKPEGATQRMGVRKTLEPSPKL